MQTTQLEVLAVAEAINQNSEAAILLDELSLSLVGGGCGDPAFI